MKMSIALMLGFTKCDFNSINHVAVCRIGLIVAQSPARLKLKSRAGMQQHFL
jgi:hypothetical protein